MLEILLEILGGLLLLIQGVRLLRFLWTSLRLYILPCYFGVKKDLTEYGKWAVVTGATDGIGKAIAKELAKRKINIVLISRSADKLEATAKEFADFNVEVHTIAYDFTDVEHYDTLEKELQEMDVGILVNNVGMFYQQPEYFGQLCANYCDDLINVNVNSVHRMTRVVLGGMSRRRRGLIVNVSSVAGERPFPFFSFYSASKAFVTFLSKAMHHEYSSSGIHIQVLTTGCVSTKLSDLKENGTIVPSPETYAGSAVNTFGLASVTTGWFWHELHAWFLALVPNALLMKLKPQQKTQ